MIIDTPTKVEELIVPGQGFGLGPISNGTQKFRDYCHQNFAKDVAPDGAENIYLSRSALGGLEGGAILEERIEANLINSGYDIIHPQKHTIAQQVAMFKAAKRVVGLDGSAFHLFGFVANNTQRAAIILRRNSSVFNGLKNQIEKFAGIKTDIVSTVVADWIPKHKNRPGRYSFGELDQSDLSDQLKTAGYISANAEWDVPRFREMKQAMIKFGAEKGTEYRRTKKSGRSAKQAQS